jgi:hypothetical protein
MPLLKPLKFRIWRLTWPQKVLNAVNVIIHVCKEFGLVGSGALKASNTRSVLAPTVVRMKNGIRHDLAPNGPA